MKYAIMLFALAVLFARISGAEVYVAFNVFNLPPGDSVEIACYPEGDDGPTLVFHSSGHVNATGTTLWQGFVGQEVKLGQAWDATSHIGAIEYGSDRLMYVLHIFDNTTKAKVARLFIDFQEPQVFLAGPEPTNEWVYLVWECNRG